MSRLRLCTALSSVVLLACGPEPTTGGAASQANAKPQVLVHERDAAMPEGFPLPLPDLAEVLDGQRLETSAGTRIFSVTARTQTEDIDDVQEALLAELDTLGMEALSTRIPGGQGKLVTIEASDPSCEIEVGAMLHLDARGDQPPGVMVILTWTQRG